jgi:hypothetical protein
VFGLVQRVFGDINQKLGDREYFYEGLSFLDVVLYSSTAFFVFPTLPQPMLPDYIQRHYPRLVAHCHRVHDRLIVDLPALPRQPASYNWSGVLAQAFALPDALYRPIVGKKLASKQEVESQRKRFYYFVALLGTSCAWAYSQDLFPGLPGFLVAKTPLVEDAEDRE